GERDAPPEHFTWGYHNRDNRLGSWRIVFLATVAGEVARFCSRELRGGNHFGFCAPAVAWQNGDRRGRYLRNPRDLILAYTGLQRARVAARSGVHATCRNQRRYRHDSRRKKFRLSYRNGFYAALGKAHLRSA